MRPAATEHDPYYERYISLVPDGDIVATLEQQMAVSSTTLSGLTERQASTPYQPGKWTLRQVVGHLSDTERIMSYRALRIARGDTRPIEGFDQDPYVQNGPFEQCSLPALLDEFRTVRAATLHLFRNLQPQAWTQRGVANNAEVTVRALAYIIAGHELHHLRLIQQRYLAKTDD